jgi:hypothetical protein
MPRFAILSAVSTFNIGSLSNQAQGGLSMFVDVVVVAVRSFSANLSFPGRWRAPPTI